jgi:hypothetical protein
MPAPGALYLPHTQARLGEAARVYEPDGLNGTAPTSR